MFAQYIQLRRKSCGFVLLSSDFILAMAFWRLAKRFAPSGPCANASSFMRTPGATSTFAVSAFATSGFAVSTGAAPSWNATNSPSVTRKNCRQRILGFTGLSLLADCGEQEFRAIDQRCRADG